MGVNGDFGYIDRNLGDGVYEITYIGASVRVSAVSPSPDTAGAPEQEKVRDLAIWRAAELAEAGGFVGFRIERETRDNDIRVYEEVVPRPLWYPMYGYYGPYYHRPWWFGDGYGSYDVRRRASLRAKITIRVRMVPELTEPDPSVLNAATTKAEIQARRASAAY